MKRTTLSLNERTLIELNRVATARGQTLSAVADELLADGIRRARAPKKRTPSLPVFNMGQPRVNIADRDQLWDGMERS